METNVERWWRRYMVLQLQVQSALETCYSTRNVSILQIFESVWKVTSAVAKHRFLSVFRLLFLVMKRFDLLDRPTKRQNKEKIIILVTGNWPCSCSTITFSFFIRIIIRKRKQNSYAELELSSCSFLFFFFPVNLNSKSMSF